VEGAYEPLPEGLYEPLVSIVIQK